MCVQPPQKIKRKAKENASDTVNRSAINHNRSSKLQKRSTNNWFDTNTKKDLKILCRAYIIRVTLDGSNELVKRLMGNVVVNEYGVMNLTELKDKFKAKCLPHSGLTG